MELPSDFWKFFPLILVGVGGITLLIILKEYFGAGLIAAFLAVVIYLYLKPKRKSQ